MGILKKSNYSRAILDLSNVPTIDYTSSRAIAEICNIYKENSVQIEIIDTNTKVRNLLENIGIDSKIII